MKEKYSNRLVNSASAYLQQHAHNPVDWHPWGKEALDLAKKENKPILLSIGYSTCYWCHVMEREVFEKADIAAAMNEYFINIKVDREERPDLDELYMVARQLITKEGGWPNNIFLTPDLKPYFAGGTFAADEKYGRPSFPSLLKFLNEAWHEKREMVISSAESITEKIAAVMSRRGEDAIDLPHDITEDLKDYLSENYDAEYGGFYKAPKFPHETEILFLLEYHKISNDGKAKDIALSSLKKMAAGGIFDHAGGGFHRYSVDREWHVPHFEKMLYNQANLALCYAKAYEISGDYFYKYTAQRTLDFTAKEMTGEAGAFYSAYDAETDGAEGAYYAWSEEEIANLLDMDEREIFFSFYGFADIPHFPGHKHPNGKTIIRKKDFKDTEEELKILKPILEKILTERKKRKSPLLDKKIIAAWNGMMIKTFAESSEISGNYLNIAINAADFLVKNMLDKTGRLHRIYNAGKKSIPGFLEDYAYAISGFLSLYEHSADKKWLNHGLNLLEKTEELFSDEHGGYFLSEATELPFRAKNSLESAFPSANSVMAHNFISLWKFTNEQKYLEKAKSNIAAFSQEIANFPAQYTHMINALMKIPARENFSSSSKVKIEKKIISKNQIEIILEIENGWHIAAEHLKITGSENLEIKKIILPKLKKLLLNNENLDIFSNKISLQLIHRLKNQEDGFINISYQICNNYSCLASSKAIIEIPFNSGY